MFASESVTEHLLRGVVGLMCFAAAMFYGPAHPLFAVLAVPVGLISLRGCPTCWTVGLVQTLAAKATGRPVDTACQDGSC